MNNSIEKLKELMNTLSDLKATHDNIYPIFLDYKRIVENQLSANRQLYGCVSEFSNIKDKLDEGHFRSAKENILDDISAAIGVIELNSFEDKS